MGGGGVHTTHKLITFTVLPTGKNETQNKTIHLHIKDCPPALLCHRQTLETDTRPRAQRHASRSHWPETDKRPLTLLHIGHAYQSDHAYLTGEPSVSSRSAAEQWVRWRRQAGGDLLHFVTSQHTSRCRELWSCVKIEVAVPNTVIVLMVSEVDVKQLGIPIIMVLSENR